MITALSALLWFISQHPLLTFFSAMVLAGLVSWWRRFPGYAIVVFPLAMLNIFPRPLSQRRLPQRGGRAR